MRAKLASLICAVSTIAVLSVSSTYAAVNVADNGGLGAAKPAVNRPDTIVAQAWWDAAAHAANAQQQVTTGQGPPAVHRGPQRYRR
jgi:hypothetical protein